MCPKNLVPPKFIFVLNIFHFLLDHAKLIPIPQFDCDWGTETDAEKVSELV